MSGWERRPAGGDPAYIGTINGSGFDRTEYAVWVDLEKKRVWATWDIGQEASYDFSKWPPHLEDIFKCRLWEMVETFREGMKDPSISPNSELR